MQFPKLDSIITEKDFEIALNFIATHLYLAYPFDDFIIGYWQSLKEKATQNDWYMSKNLIECIELLMYALV